MNFRNYLAQQQKLVEAHLDRLAPPETQPPETIHRAMRYSLFAGGKRIRPILCLEAARASGEEPSAAHFTAACALELIHTYSLIHDDLPALDNDDYRRGKLTCHKVFGEAMAILAGDSLLTLAFEVLAAVDAIAADRKSRMIAELATAVGTVGGMIAGQVADLEGEGQPPSAGLLESIHRAKTGALIRVSVVSGGVYAGANADDVARLDHFGRKAGLAFQIADDVLDMTADSATLGKTPGKDQATEKATWPAVFGIEQSRRDAARLIEEAFAALEPYGSRANGLKAVARYLVERKN